MLKKLTLIFLLISVICVLSASAEADEARCLFAKEGYIEGTVTFSGKTISVTNTENNRSIPLSDMIFIKFPARYNPTIIEEGVVLTNGNIITGSVEILEKRNVQISSGVFGRKIIQEKDIAQVVLTAQKLYYTKRNFDENEGLLLRNGDRMPGVIKWISEKTIAIEGGIMGLIDVPRGNVAVLHYRAVDRKNNQDPFEIKCKNGDRITAGISSLSSSQAVISHQVFGSVNLSSSFIKEIRASRIKADNLSLIVEDKVENTPYFDSIRNIRKDRSFSDEFLAIDGEAYDRGIIAMSKTSISYSLDGSYKAFYAELGIDESVGDSGSVTFTITVDGRTVYESKETVTGAMDPIPVLIKLENAKKMKITVDFAEGGSVADFAVLGDTLLIKQ